VRIDHRLEAVLAYAVRALVRAVPRGAALSLGARLGDVARWLGIRRSVAEENLALAFPELGRADRDRILVAHYRDFGMMVCEAARGTATSEAPPGEVIAEVRGDEHLEAALRGRRGAIVLTAHYGDFGLLGAWLARGRPVDIVAKELRNPAVDALMVRTCMEAGMRRILPGAGLKPLLAGLRANHVAVILADQDAGADGVFVPFLGRSCSTTSVPARIALRTGVPLLTAFITRRADLRNEIDVLPPLTVERPDAPDAVERLTALHAAELERWVRRHPHMWFWLHRRWKTSPPASGSRDHDAAEPGGGRLVGASAVREA